MDMSEAVELFNLGTETQLKTLVESEGLDFLRGQISNAKMRRLRRQLSDGRLTAQGLARQLGGHKNAIKLLPSDTVLPPCIKYMLDFDLL